MSFTQGAPTQPLSILASNVFLTGSSAAGNAFTVQQLGVGNVFSAQTSTGATALIINPSGLVGIGLTNPSTLIDIIGNTSVNSISNTIAQFRAASSTGVNDAGIVIGSTNGNAPFIGDNASAASLGLAFQTNRTTRVQINPSGLVGIGTSPTAQLHVYQSNGSGYQLSVNNVANAGGTNYSSFIHSDQAYCGGVGGVGQYTYSGASLLVTSYPNNTSNNSGYTAYFGTSANDATSLASQMVIKAATGYVGIGLTNPGAVLTVVGGSSTPVVQIHDSSSGGPDYGATYGMVNLTRAADTVKAHVAFIRAGNYVWQMGYISGTNNFGMFPFNFSGTQGTPTMTWSGGNVGIGTASPTSYTLQVSGTIGATGNITAFTSDKRLKKKTGKIEKALDKVSRLEGFTYVHNETAKEHGFKDDRQYVGLSAQDLQEVLPEVVFPAPFDAENQSGQNYLTVQYERIVPLLVEALKEERAKRESLEERLMKLEKLVLQE